MQLLSLTDMQLSMLFGMIHGDKAQYVSQAVLRINHSLDFERLCTAVNAGFNNHEITRARVDFESGEYRLELQDTVDFSVDLYDIQEKNQFSYSEFISKLRIEPFDLSCPPLMRVTLIKESDFRYSLVFTYPHFLMDGISALKCLEDIFSYYDLGKLTYEINEESSYNLFLNRYFSYDRSECREYWKRSLKRYVPTLLPKITHECARHQIKEISCMLEADISRKVKQKSKLLRVTPNIFFQATLVFLLAKFCNQKIISFGTTRQYSTDVKGKSTGLFLSILPISVDLDTFGTEHIFHQLVTQNRSLKKQYLISPSELKQLSGISTNSSMFNVVIDYKPENPIQALLEGSDNWKCREFQFNTMTENALLIEVFAMSDKFEIRFSGLESWIGFDYLKSISNYFIDQALILTEEKSNCSKDICFFYGKDEAEYLSASLHKQIISCIRANSASSAVLCGDVDYSFSEIYQKVCNLAALLYSSDLKGDCVVVYMERGVECVVSALTLLLMGYTYVPIDRKHPTRRNESILRSTRAMVCITLKELLTDFNSRYDISEMRVIAYDDTNNVSISEVENKFDLSGTNSTPYIIFTSGTTGNPKGAINRLISLQNRLFWMKSELSVNKDDVIMHKTEITFDVSIWELYLTFISGAKMVILPACEHFDVKLIQDAIKKYNVTMIHFVPSFLSSAIELFTENVYGSLRKIVCSGDELTIDLTKKIYKILPFVKLYNLYGPSETAIDVTSFYVDSKIDSFQRIPIGKPIANTRVSIVDFRKELMPRYAIGELAIGNVAVGAGYISDFQKTKNSFVNMPFDNESMYYLTGDLVYADSENNIIYIGRNDTTKKINGVRIDLSEVNLALMNIEGVEQAYSVVNYNQHISTSYISSYVVINAKYQFTTQTIREKIRSYLPDSFLPTRITRVEAFEFNSSGKIDISKLPDDSIHDAEPVKIGCNGTGLQMIIKSVLTLNHDPDFTSSLIREGGTSIDAMIVAARVKKELKKSISISQMLSGATFAELLADMSDVHEDNCAQAREGKVGSIKLSHLQEKLFIQAQLAPDHLYTMCAYFEFNDFPREKVELLISFLTDRHPILLARIVNIDGDYILDSQPKESASIYQFEKLPNKIDVMKRIKLMSKVGINIVSDNLCKFVVFETSDNKLFMLMMVHHIIFDAFSIEILKKDIKDFILPSNTSLLSPDYSISEKHRDFYLERCVKSDVQNHQGINFNMSPLLYDFESTDYMSSAKRQILNIDRDLKEQLTGICKELECTPNVLFLTALQIAIRCLSAEINFIIGVITSVRLQPDIQNMIGLFVTVLNLKCSLHENLTVEQVINMTKENFNGILDSFFMGIDDNSNDSMSRESAQIVFNYLQNGDVEKEEYIVDTVKFVPIENQSVKYPIKLQIFDCNEGISGFLEYSGNLFEYDTVLMLKHTFLESLKQVATNKRFLLGDLQLDDGVFVC